MQRWILVLALLAGPSAAADDLDTMNAVSDAWDRYALESSRSDPDAAKLLAASSLEDAAFMRDVALFASPAQIRRLPLSKRLEAYALRVAFPADELASFDPLEAASACIRIHACGIAEPEDGQAMPRLSHVTLLGPAHAIGELAPHDGVRYNFGHELVLEEGRWKVRSESTVNDESAYIAQAAQSGGLTEDQVTWHALDAILARGDALPPLALLEQPPRDDAQARNALNERWPRYEAAYDARVAALEVKAGQGEDTAMQVLGTLYYTGVLAPAAPLDRERGLTLLEQASEAGNHEAAVLAMVAMGEMFQPTEAQPYMPGATLERMARHARRGAEGGNADAMATYASLLFNGAGGLQRDCRQAAEWAGRAEDAGAPFARNDRAWYLSTCPIAAQRDVEQALELAGHLMQRRQELAYAELDTVAAVLAANGRFGEAVDYQRQAIGLADEDGAATPQMKARLAAYEAREDWVQDYNALVTEDAG